MKNSKLVLLVSMFIFPILLFAEERGRILKQEDVYFLKICQTEQRFSAKAKDIFKCIEEKKANKEYSDYMTYETFEDLKY